MLIDRRNPPQHWPPYYTGWTVNDALFPVHTSMESKFNNFLCVCWFLVKNLSNFVSLPWKLHNRYCHKLLSKIAYPLGHLSDRSSMMHNLLMLWWGWKLWMMMKMQLLLPLKPGFMLRCGEVWVQSYNSRGRCSQVIGISANDSVIRIFREIEPNVLQWHRTVGMLVHSWTVFLDFSHKKHFRQEKNHCCLSGTIQKTLHCVCPFTLYVIYTHSVL